MTRSLALFTALCVLTLLGCTPQETAPPASTASTPQPAAEPAKAVEATAAANEELAMSYMVAAAALGVDDFETAKAALTGLAKESHGEFQKLAQTAADTGQIAAMREAFKPLSEAATKMKLPADYAVAFCPMFKGGSKWVQKRETLSNPYFGKAMATCGNFIN